MYTTVLCNCGAPLSLKYRQFWEELIDGKALRFGCAALNGATSGTDARFATSQHNERQACIELDAWNRLELQCDTCCVIKRANRFFPLIVLDPHDYVTGKGNIFEITMESARIRVALRLNDMTALERTPFSGTNGIGFGPIQEAALCRHTPVYDVVYFL